MKNIQLSQDAISAGQKYTVQINGRVRFFVDSAPMEILDDYFIRKPDDEEVIFSVYERVRLWNAKYLIQDRLGKKEYVFRSKSYWYNSYTCTSKDENDVYEFFEHTGLRYSVYKNGELIAYATCDRFTVFQNDFYDIQMSENGNVLLIVSMFLCFDDYRSNGGFLVGMKLGVLMEEKPFCGNVNV